MWWACNTGLPKPCLQWMILVWSKKFRWRIVWMDVIIMLQKYPFFPFLLDFTWEYMKSIWFSLHVHIWLPEYQVIWLQWSTSWASCMLVGRGGMLLLKPCCLTLTVHNWSYDLCDITRASIFKSQCFFPLENAFCIFLCSLHLTA